MPRRVFLYAAGLIGLGACASSPDITSVDCGVRAVNLEVGIAQSEVASNEFEFLLKRELQERGFVVTDAENADATLIVSLRTEEQFRAGSSHSGVGSSAGSSAGGTGSYAGSYVSSGSSSAYTFTESYVLAKLQSPEAGEIWQEYFEPGGVFDIGERLAARWKGNTLGSRASQVATGLAKACAQGWGRAAGGL